MIRKPVVAELVNQSLNQTSWFIQWPSRQGRTWGRSYYAITYPGSDLIRIETAAKRRAVSDLQGRKILPIIRAAIEAAKNKTEAL